jgi:nucleotide-binding universal stress UspA family protein
VEGAPGIPDARRVLAPTDFSAHAARAVSWAYALAGPGGSVVLLHVLERAATPNPLYAHYERGPAQPPEERRGRELELRDRLRALAPPGEAHRGVATEVEVAESADVAECILDAAKRLRCDAICIATRGRGAIARKILGSVAEAVLRAAGIPVFLVPPPRG